MKLSEVVNKVIEIGDKVRDYYDRELPKAYRRYPIAEPDEREPAASTGGSGVAGVPVVAARGDALQTDSCFSIMVGDRVNLDEHGGLLPRS